MGKDLLVKVIEATGLPPELIGQQLLKMLAAAGIDPQEVTLDQLREILASEIGEALLRAKEESRNAL